MSAHQKSRRASSAASLRLGVLRSSFSSEDLRSTAGSWSSGLPTNNQTLQLQPALVQCSEAPLSGVKHQK